MNIEHKLKEVNVKKVLIVTCSCIGVLVVFQVGVLVGYSKATYSDRLGDNYYKTFDRQSGTPNRILLMGMEVPGGHGAVGKVVQLNFPTFIVAGPDNVEKVVRIDSTTLVRHFKDKAASTSLRVDDTVIVVGSPNDDGEVVAKLIRIMPARSR